MRTIRFATADLNNGVLEIFNTVEDAEKSLTELIEEGNAINDEHKDECESDGLEAPKAEDFYSIVEVDENGNVL